MGIFGFKVTFFVSQLANMNEICYDLLLKLILTKIK
jgi:hypothetical protein